uniref:Uncharacterized protein n=1 Tax=Panagrolaimus sp. PS1159 TaxID=55785 RepID=A0AC35GDW5_9BILA
MALALGVSSAFTPVTSTSIKVEPSSMPASSFIPPLPTSSSSSSIGLQLPTPSTTNFRSLAEVAYLEYAMYLLLNVNPTGLMISTKKERDI